MIERRLTGGTQTAQLSVLGADGDIRSLEEARVRGGVREYLGAGGHAGLLRADTGLGAVHVST